MLPIKFKNQVNRLSKNELLWKGPIEDGVTFSMLGKFLMCRERFRVYITEGLRGFLDFESRIEYGNMFHLCKEHYLAKRDWKKSLLEYGNDLRKRFPNSVEQISHWVTVCGIQFPIYTKYWKDFSNKKPYLQEQVFSIPYKLPTGRIVKLRGKLDSVDEQERKYWIQENKTKSEIDPIKIIRQLKNDFQSMLYSVAFTNDEVHKRKFAGVRYNLVLRPLSGGKGTIRQKKGESKDEFYVRLKEVLEGMVREDPNSIFTRYEIGITQEDLENFKAKTLNPILEGLCDWYEWIKHCHKTNTSPFCMIHWIHPNGYFNPINEGKEHELDSYLESGNLVGLTRVKSLFRELEI